MTSRNELRRHLRIIRQNTNIAGNFWTIFPGTARNLLQQRLAGADAVGLYLAVGSEVDVQPLFDDVAKAGAIAALPRVPGRGSSMTFHRWSQGDALEKADFGFQQPLPDAPPITPDIFIVPLLGFDAALNRLGQGAGHYDRYFSRVPKGLKIGIAWSAQQVEALPVEPWDIPLDAVLTEKGWIERLNPAKEQ
jgi:5-formyltetrahydrofolate cyclo-ligase